MLAGGVLCGWSVRIKVCLNGRGETAYGHVTDAAPQLATVVISANRHLDIYRASLKVTRIQSLIFPVRWRVCFRFSAGSRRLVSVLPCDNPRIPTPRRSFSSSAASWCTRGLGS
ncbi:hypothetical protein KCP69_02160 [Salmonella enterica subsp. enterica]|nr:hypothetical protein KCP69_02160 [Salmonella enterica subsp. enterica]